MIREDASISNGIICMSSHKFKTGIKRGVCE